MFELVINGKVQVFSRQIETLADLLIELNIVADGRVIEVNNSGTGLILIFNLVFAFIQPVTLFLTAT